MKKVLILNTSHNDLRMILALKDMGFYVISTGNTPGLVGQKYVDEYFQADYSNKDLILNFAQEKCIDAICACCNDLGVITAAYVAEEMNLPGHDTYENTLIMHHKDRFKQFSKEYGINTPIANYFSEEADALEWAYSAEYPMIVKPTDLSAGRGVSKVDNYQELISAIKKAFAASRVKKIVIEPFIDGTQHACCTFIINKRVVAYCTNNEYSFVNPYRVEIDTYPADNFDCVKKQIIEEAEKMASILDLKDGILSMQYRIKDEKPYILEAMRRVLGNLYMIPAEKLTGINWDYWEAKTHCGLDCSDFPIQYQQQGFYAYRTVMGTQNGLAKNIKIPKSFEKYIFDQCILWESQKPIIDFMSEPLAFIFFKFDSKEEMNKIVLDHYSDIYVEY